MPLPAWVTDLGLLNDAFSTAQATIVKQQAAEDELVLCRSNTL